MKSDGRRNLNPTAEALIAMTIWGDRYSQQAGGSMDFWDSLTDHEKRRCSDLAARVREADHAHKAR